MTGRDTSRRRIYVLHHEQGHVSSTPEPITSVPAGRPKFKLIVMPQPRVPRAQESTNASEQLECSERPGSDFTVVFVAHVRSGSVTDRLENDPYLQATRHRFGCSRCLSCSVRSPEGILEVGLVAVCAALIVNGTSRGIHAISSSLPATQESNRRFALLGTSDSARSLYELQLAACD